MLSKLFPSNKNNTPNKLALSRTSVKIKTLYAFIALLGVSLLSGCGFKLRNDYELAKQFSAIQISSAERHSRLQKTLSNRLEFLDVKVNQSRTTFTTQTATIHLQPESLDRRLLSLFPSGQVAEYELLYNVNYLYYPAQNAQGNSANSNQPLEAIEKKFVLTREYQDDPDQVLAKSRELDLILEELRVQAADRIIRSLSVTP